MVSSDWSSVFKKFPQSQEEGGVLLLLLLMMMMMKMTETPACEEEVGRPPGVRRRRRRRKTRRRRGGGGRREEGRRKEWGGSGRRRSEFKPPQQERVKSADPCSPRGAATRRSPQETQRRRRRLVQPRAAAFQPGAQRPGAGAGAPRVPAPPPGEDTARIAPGSSLIYSEGPAGDSHPNTSRLFSLDLDLIPPVLPPPWLDGGYLPELSPGSSASPAGSMELVSTRDLCTRKKRFRREDGGGREGKEKEAEEEEEGRGGLWENGDGRETGGTPLHVRTRPGKKALVEFKVKKPPPTPGEVGRGRTQIRVQTSEEKTPSGL
ncbi:unnamed protein product [Pleuronectes platessa]|uniref:Uncharacterized protein n=1 Tax=Pleuronectes platessa TaxID=8262 RepID=A0A9N7TJE3_PLEPL|nr:unnamed protein product [Pleuronectes platessa]